MSKRTPGSLKSASEFQPSTAADKKTTSTRAGQEGPKSIANRSIVAPSQVSSLSGSISVGCGYGTYRPAWLQVLHNSKCFLICLCFCAITQGMIVNSFLPVDVTTLQKRLELSSTHIGIMMSTYDTAVILSLLPVSYFGGKGHKPRWMGYGLLIMGVGSFFFASPSFFLDPYVVNGTTQELCQVEHDINDNSSQPLDCNKTGTSTLAKMRFYYFILLLAQVLHGVGSTPIYTLGITFLDESVPQALSPVYLGLFYAISLFGVIIGFTFGGALLRINGDVGKIDVSKVEMKPDDPLWYGAWWIGFIITGSLSIIVSIPVFAFARRLPEAKKNRLQDINQAQATSEPGTSKTSSDLPKAILQLVKNIPYLCVMATKCAEAFLLTGFTTFLPKILENFFSLSASDSSFLTGLILIPGGLAGTILGGYVVCRCNLRCRAMIVMTLICQVVSFCFVFVYLIYCEDARFVGVNEPPFNSSHVIQGEVIDDCNAKCSCSNYYQPVCHSSSKVAFYSPCHAGCVTAEQVLIDGKKQWSNCSCVNNTIQPISETVVQGYCDVKCNRLYLFMFVAGLFVFSTALGGMPIQQIELRCVPFNQRTLAVSVTWVFVRLLGTIPGAIIIGSAVDRSCSLWKKECGENVSCLSYYNKNLSYDILSFGISFKSFILICLVVALLCYRPSAGSDDEPTKIVASNQQPTDKNTAKAAKT